MFSQMSDALATVLHITSKLRKVNVRRCMYTGSKLAYYYKHVQPSIGDDEAINMYNLLYEVINTYNLLMVIMKPFYKGAQQRAETEIMSSFHNNST